MNLKLIEFISKANRYKSEGNLLHYPSVNSDNAKDFVIYKILNIIIENKLKKFNITNIKSSLECCSELEKQNSYLSNYIEANHFYYRDFFVSLGFSVSDGYFIHSDNTTNIFFQIEL